MIKYYFLNDQSEMSYTKGYFIELMKELGVDHIEVIEAKIQKIAGWLWCKEYLPRNGKSGICKNHGYFREPTDKKIILRL